MTEFIVLAILFWLPVFIVLLKNSFWDLYFWEIKEYRWDRLWTHLRWDQDEHNRNYFITGFKFLLFALTSLMFKLPIIAILAILITYIFWIFESFDFLQKLFSEKKPRRPSIKSPRNILILSLFLLFITILIVYITFPFAEISRSTESDLTTSEYITQFINTSSENFIESNNFPLNSEGIPDIYLFLGLSTLLGLFLDMGGPILISIFVGITQPVAYIRRRIKILQAVHHLHVRKKPLKIVAITGSQGKTTAKELLYQLIKDDFIVAKTPENYNTDFGVATSILSKVKKNTEIFIAEMGAYKRGEIRTICEHFPPDISIITDIDTQHLGIFGSRAALAIGKSEIVKYAKQNSVSILNGDNEWCRKIASINENKKIFVYSDKNSEDELNEVKEKYENIGLIEGNNNENKSDTISFIIVIDGKKHKLTTHLIGDHLLNILMQCIVTAIELGVDIETLKNRLSEFKMELPRLTLDTGDNDTIILNDSYNSSIKGFSAAVKYANKIKKGSAKVMVITKGIFELGREKENLYKQLAENISNEIDILITTDALLSRIFKSNNLKMRTYLIKDADEIIYKFREETQPGDIVLLEGKLNPKVIKTIVSDKN
jgi:UDP-N-acetylmuramyl pentapeptide synthase